MLQAKMVILNMVFLNVADSKAQERRYPRLDENSSDNAHPHHAYSSLALTRDHIFNVTDHHSIYDQQMVSVDYAVTSRL